MLTEADSRSQQRFNGGLPSAPSFVDYQWSADDSDADTGTPGEYDTESAWSGDEHDDSATSEVFFPTDPVRASQERSMGPASGALALSTVTEREEEISPKGTPLATPSLPSKRGGIMSLFSTTPPVLSSSVGSNGSQTPRPPVKLLPDVEATSPQTSTGNRYHAQRGSLGLHPFPGPANSKDKNKTPPADNSPLPAERATETTPLLRPSPRRPSRSTPKRPWVANGHLSPTVSSRRSSMVGRRGSVVRRRSKQIEHVGESSDGQTVS